ncbi:MAG: amino-acid N-acetyltransferase [Candidatus Nanopelagicales bacterium]
MSGHIRPARTPDVGAIHDLIAEYTEDRRMLAKARVTLYEDVQEFIVVERDGEIVACGALHVMWEDLAEVRSLAVRHDSVREGLGSQVLRVLLDRAQVLGIERVFCLTFETEFFGQHGFTEFEGTPVEHEVFEQLLQSFDEGVAEFLDLERVKPNTLGNHRMLMLLR